MLIMASGTGATVCSQLGPLLKLIGMVITIFKIVIPILLIIFGMLDVGKSVVAGKPEEITKNLKAFGMRALAAILIFFIPSIVGVVMTAVAQSGGQDASEWEACKTNLGLN